MTIIEELRRYEGTQYRSATVEKLDADHGSILLRAVPYGEEVQLDRQLFEQFDSGAFSRSAEAPSRVKLWNEHTGPLIGCGTEIEERDSALFVRCRFANTLAGQEARELASDGILDECSITFRPQADWMKVERRSDGLHVRHARAHLLGVALVAHAAYGRSSVVASVRGLEDAERKREETLARLRSYNH